MDIITKKILDEFSFKNQFSKLKESDQFELLSNFCVINKEIGNTKFDLSLTLTGLGTQGIDGIAIIVNNKPCNSISFVEGLLDYSSHLEIDFVFIQSKTSSKFSCESIGGFFDWVKTFLDDDANLHFKTDEMERFIEIKDYLINNATLMKRNPRCYLYYVSAGRWENDSNVENVINRNKKDIVNGSLIFDELEFYPIDAKQLQTLYRKTSESNTASFLFEKRVILPSIDKVDVALSGVLPFSEFKKIIINDNGKIKSVFEDNIRDFLHTTKNPVNIDISDTLKGYKKEYFSILNNGITVVASSFSGPSDKITISDYQIVNGCQTSHVLCENLEIDEIDSIQIPLKIIITKDPEIKNWITRATNNQTQVKLEQLEALNEFQKQLELYYHAKLVPDIYKIYYERRTNQYSSQSEIEPFRIIDIEIQIKTFASMFLDLPHYVAGYYGKLWKEYSESIFNEKNNLALHYTSALTFFVVDQLFKEGMLNLKYYKYRFHIIMVYRYLVTNSRIPPMNGTKAVEAFCSKFESILINKPLVTKYMNKALDLILSDELSIERDRKTTERKLDTQLILDYVRKADLKAEDIETFVPNHDPHNLSFTF